MQCCTPVPVYISFCSFIFSILIFLAIVYESGQLWVSSVYHSVGIKHILGVVPLTVVTELSFSP